MFFIILEAMRNRVSVVVIIVACLFFASCVQERTNLILFDKSVLSDSTMWEVEQGDYGNVLFTKEGIEIIDGSGCTVWFKTKLKQPVVIEYDIMVIDKGDEFDRLSDMNVFWLASDPKHSDDLFYNNHGRKGEFQQYDSLQLYYVGMGGHDNTRTRYRRYDGLGNKNLEEQHNLSHNEVLLEPNKVYTIRIETNENRVIYMRDEKVIYDIIDDDPLQMGWFGFRTWRSHQFISNLKIFNP